MGDRFTHLADRLKEMTGRTEEIRIYSAPGRTEIGGNHTDHQNGRVLAAAVNLETVAAVMPRDDDKIRLVSESFPDSFVDLSETGPLPSDEGSSEGLIRGIAAYLSDKGYKTGGFDAYVTSTIPAGSGLSSSAAFEILIGFILSDLYNNGSIDPVVLAMAGQSAENRYFGKPCGLMDQTACASGGLTAIDFKDPSAPEISRVDLDLKAAGYDICITNTGGSHAGLTAEYAAIPSEMRSVAGEFGQDTLRGISSEDILGSIASLRSKTSDRAILRALHFTEENERVKDETEALKRKDLQTFFELIRRSGDSSFKYLQNIYTNSDPLTQALSIALAATDVFLGPEGAFRVHGGGFAGTIQAFVPEGLTEGYRALMDKMFGEGSCLVLSIRDQGGIRYQ